MSNTPIQDLCRQRLTELKQGPKFQNGRTRSIKLLLISLIASVGAAYFADVTDSFFLEVPLILASITSAFAVVLFASILMEAYLNDFPAPINEEVVSWLAGQLHQLPRESLHPATLKALEQIATDISKGVNVTLKDAAYIERRALAECPVLDGDARAFVDAFASRKPSH